MVPNVKSQTIRAASPKVESTSPDRPMAPYVTVLPSVSDIPRQELRKGFAFRVPRDDAGATAAQ